MCLTVCVTACTPPDRQHGVTIPAVTGDFSKMLSLSAAAVTHTPPRSRKALTAETGVGDERGDVEGLEEGAGLVEGGAVQESSTSSTKLASSPSPAAVSHGASKAVASVLAHNDIATAPPLMFDDSSSDDGSDVDASADAADGAGGRELDSMEFDVDAALEKGGKGTADFEFVGGGLERCLLEMDALTSAYQKRCVYNWLIE